MGISLLIFVRSLFVLVVLVAMIQWDIIGDKESKAYAGKWLAYFANYDMQMYQKGSLVELKTIAIYTAAYWLEVLFIVFAYFNRLFHDMPNNWSYYTRFNILVHSFKFALARIFYKREKAQ